jgi:glycosyltransferase involved in cell wall biosynthesis
MNLLLIIVNDGSTEPQVAEILSKYEPYSEIIIKNLEENKGVANALNIGI